MPENAEPSHTPSDVARLLHKAVKSLPEEEQAAVFEYFFERGIGGPVPAASIAESVREALAANRFRSDDVRVGPSATIVRCRSAAGRRSRSSRYACRRRRTAG